MDRLYDAPWRDAEGGPAGAGGIPLLAEPAGQVR